MMIPIRVASLVVATAFLILRMPAGADGQRGSKPPNFVFVFTDDQQFAALGSNGNPHIQTPHLDGFAATAVRFENAHAVFALCAPSRAAVLTGQYGSRNGKLDFKTTLKPGFRTFAHYLKDMGYATAVVGKWHLERKPADCGFDKAATFWANGTYYGWKVAVDGVVKKPAEMVDEFCVDRSIDWLRDRKKARSPFVLFHCTQLPHMDGKRTWPAKEETLAKYDLEKQPLPETWDDPLTGKPPYLSQSRNRVVAQKEYGYGDANKLRAHARRYYAIVTEVDAALGRLFAELEVLGLRENTWVIVMSDNGCLLGEHGMTSKILAYRESTRVPLLIAGPGVKPGVRDEIVLNIDIAPTLLELAGIAVPEEMQGRSLVPVLEGSVGDWREVFIYEGLGTYANLKPHLAAVGIRWKLIRTLEGKGSGRVVFEELYDQVNDPNETTNLADAGEHAESKKVLSEVIDAHLKQMGRKALNKGEGSEK